MAGAVVAGVDAGGHADFGAAAGAMTAVRDTRYEPDAAAHAVYDRLFALYKRMHDIYGVEACSDSLYDLMKEVQNIRDEARNQ
jgi:L-ribulokinase